MFQLCFNSYDTVDYPVLLTYMHYVSSSSSRYIVETCVCSLGRGCVSVA